MQLTTEIFAPIVTAFTDNVPVIVAFIIGMFAITFVIRLTKNYVSPPDVLYAQKVRAENDVLMKK